MQRTPKKIANQKSVWPDGKTMTNCNRRYPHKYFKWNFVMFLLLLPFAIAVSLADLHIRPGRHTHTHTPLLIHEQQLKCVHYTLRCQRSAFGETVLRTDLSVWAKTTTTTTATTAECLAYLLLQQQLLPLLLWSLEVMVFSPVWFGFCFTLW